ncbi:hypothetical protein TL16_g07898 [Triparma laevis f. inornata]|uniref:TNFR-Cys domain-containing protein n=1 Tax=Triparma laevis f. inornata TaxID=1714386 RepID=A0A9W7AY44_9STRA|nr:hypothetical protein TL16_g07898 [Triparma laevis f. inornata]
MLCAFFFCPAGKYSENVAAVSSLTCLDCSAGKYSESVSATSSDTCLDCASGKFSSEGFSSCTNCEAGKYKANEGQGSCTNCGAGRYSTTTGNPAISFCLNCEAGKSSSEKVQISPCPACPEGKSAPAPGLSTCPSCPAGTYSDDPNGATTCALCAEGKYTSAAQSTSCDTCDPGTFNIVEGSVACDKCPSGQKMNKAGNGCEVCPDGMFSNPGSLECTDCAHTDGYVALAGDSGAAACEYCGPGFYADQSSHTCKQCEVNSYSVGGSNECDLCPAGTDNAVASKSCSPCPPGKIPTGSSCDQCEKGEYGEFGATSCSPCDGDGQYADEVGLPACKTSPVGTKPMSNRQGIESCELGSASSGAQNDCAPCEGTGQYADEIGLSACKAAPAGTKPTSNRHNIENCLIGKYSLGGAEACTECEAGNFAPAEGATGCTVASTCPSGHYVITVSTPSTDTTCRICGTGMISPGGDYRTDCTWCNGEGEYSDVTGGNACKTVPAGFKPDSTHQGLEACPPGTYSTGGTNECTSCEFGKFSASEGSLGCTAASICQAGTYIAVVSTSTSDSTCNACPSGTSSSATRVRHYAACGGGKSSPECSNLESRHADDNEEIALRCCSDTSIPGWVRRPNQFADNLNPADNWCSIWSESDAWGTCQYSLNYTDAVDFCASEGARLCTKAEIEMGCAEGTGCGGMNGLLIWTSAAETVFSGQFTCTPCTGEGEYSDASKLTACKTAPSGKKPNSDRTGVGPCAPGTYSVGGADECSECEAGKMSEVGAVGCSTCTVCGTGKYKIADCTNEVETQCGDCPKNTFTISGATNINGCEECTDGGYSKPGSGYCEQCLTGKYYDELNNSCELCPKNTFSITGATNSTGCKPCDEGGHSKPGSGYCEQCLTGKYYDESSNECKLCPKNTFSISGATNINGCASCAAGEHSLEGSGYCQNCSQYVEYNETEKNCVCLPSFTRVGGDGDNGKCTCKAGETLMGTTCQPCETAKWKAEIGVTSCNLCADTLEGSITEELGSTMVEDCKCPRCTFDNTEGKCDEVEDGMDFQAVGMRLENVTIEPGYWRTGPTSTDIRQCPVPEACVGGNSSNYCHPGHDGPYCNLFKDGYAKDPFLLCQSCDTTATSVVLSILFIFVGAGILAGVVFLLKKNKNIYKRVKNGIKIIFTGLQITSALPAVVPAIPLPETFKEVVTSVQFFNSNIFQLVSAGCISSGFNYYDRLLLVTIPILLLCSALVVAGRRSEGHRRSQFIIAALAVLILTLPTVTNTVFGVFSCDTLDDERSLLRVDYSIDCNDGMRGFWLFYGVFMVLIFPVGVSAAYFKLLFNKRERIKQDVKTREEDEELKNIAFLFEPYKPELWYFEVVETIRRLLMTGVLSTIQPGTFTQLSWGISLSMVFTCTFCVVKPYNESRDNWIAIMSSGLLFLVFLSSSFIKYNQLLDEEKEAYDLIGMDILLTICYASSIGLFFWWAFHQKDDMSVSTAAMAKNTLQGTSSLGSSVGDEKEIVELSVVSKKGADLGGGAGARSSGFEVINPFAEGKGIDKNRLKQLDSFGPKEKFRKGGKGGRGGNSNKSKTEPQQKRDSFIPHPNTTAKSTSSERKEFIVPPPPPTTTTSTASRK